MTVGAIAAWGVSYENNRHYVAEVAKRVDDVRQRVNATPNRNSPDLLPVIPALEATQSLADPNANQAVPRSLGLGLFQGRKLDSAARAAYDRMLVDAVQPRLALRVEEQLRQGGDAGESQYEALKIYLMLHDPSRLDPKAVKDHIERDWDARLARELTVEQRARLSTHLDALLALGEVASPVAQDPALVATTRAQLKSVPLPQRVYDRLRQRGASIDYPDFTVVRAAGSNAELVFARASNKPLTQGVPGLFTYDGYYKGFQTEVGRVTRELADEQGWVLGVNDAKGASALQNTDAALTDDVRRIYLTEYESIWESFIADVRVVPLTSLTLSMQTARLLAAPDSPLPQLVKALAHETTLGTPLGNENAIEKARDRAAKVINDRLKSIVVQSPAGASGASLETTLVDDHFTKLRQFSFAQDGAKAPVDDVVTLLGELAVMLQAVDTALKGGAAPPPSPLPNKLKAEAATTPQPVRAMLETLSDSSERSGKAILRESLSKIVKAEVGEFCNLAIARRYPVDPLATLDANQADFAQLFGPGGKMDKVMQTSLAPYVDTSARPNWRFRPVEGTALGNDVGTLPQFQRAAVVRDTFFPGGAPTPSLRLEIKPIEMDTTIKEFVLDVDGQIVRYMHGPQIPTTVQWPGPRGSSQVRVQVTGSSGSNIGGMVTEGPWALFRMFDRIHIEPGTSPDHFRATFEVDGRKASFDVTTSSVRNPFGLKELRDFQCPSGL
jgi:type VI secretion system protein ImpL